jgi:hypothetical protein
MHKIKYADRPGWARIVNKRYRQHYVDTAEFKGMLSILYLDEVRQPLHVQYGAKRVSIVDNGYIWLQNFPMEEIMR